MVDFNLFPASLQPHLLHQGVDAKEDDRLMEILVAREVTIKMIDIGCFSGFLPLGCFPW
jgi:hypothetical protein